MSFENRTPEEELAWSWIDDNLGMYNGRNNSDCMANAFLAGMKQAQTNAQKTHGEIYSTNICDYCDHITISEDKYALS